MKEPRHFWSIVKGDFQEQQPPNYAKFKSIIVVDLSASWVSFSLLVPCLL